MSIANEYQSSQHTHELEFDCQQWDLSGRVPTRTASQKLKANFIDTQWMLYDLPTSTKGFGKPSVVAMSTDLAVIRLGSLVYTKTANGSYQPISKLDTSELFIDEIASRHRHVAISTRRDCLQVELKGKDIQLVGHIAGIGSGSLLLKFTGSIYQAVDASTNPTTADSTNETRTVETDDSSDTSLESEPELIDDVLVEDESKFAHISRRNAILFESFEEEDPLLRTDSDSSENSAEEEWSDGSSDVLSDEVEDEDEWNDWFNEVLTIEDMNLSDLDGITEDSASDGHVPEFDDLESIASQVEDLNFDEVWTASEGDEIKISGFTYTPSDIDSSAHSSVGNVSSIESGYSPSNYSDDTSD